MSETEVKSNYTPKRAAAIILTKMLAGECAHPALLQTKEVEFYVGNGWKITAKRKEAICDQIQTITGALRKRLEKIVTTA